MSLTDVKRILQLSLVCLNVFSSWKLYQWKNNSKGLLPCFLSTLVCEVNDTSMCFKIDIRCYSIPQGLPSTPRCFIQTSQRWKPDLLGLKMTSRNANHMKSVPGPMQTFCQIETASWSVEKQWDHFQGKSLHLCWQYITVLWENPFNL